MPIKNKTGQENTDQKNADQENADQENADQENADQEKYWSAKLSLCTSAADLASPFPHVANLFSPYVSQSTKMSVSQPKGSLCTSVAVLAVRLAM